MMIIGWTISLLYRNVTVVDSLWGLGFVLIAGPPSFFLRLCGAHKSHRTGYIVGAKAELYLTWRNWGKGEDTAPRSLAQEKRRPTPIVSLFKVFILQAVVMSVYSTGPANTKFNVSVATMSDLAQYRRCAVSGQPVSCSNRSATGSWPALSRNRGAKGKSWTRGCGLTPDTVTILANFSFGGPFPRGLCNPPGVGGQISAR